MLLYRAGGGKDNIFCVHLGDKKNPKTFDIFFYREPDPFLMKAVKESSSFKYIYSMQIPACALTTFPLLIYDYSQVSAPFSSGVLTFKDENKTKKLCNTKGKCLTFYFFHRKVVRSTFITDELWQLQVCVSYPEMCIAQSIPTGTNQ